MEVNPSNFLVGYPGEEVEKSKKLILKIASHLNPKDLHSFSLCSWRLHNMTKELKTKRVKKVPSSDAGKVKIPSSAQEVTVKRMPQRSLVSSDAKETWLVNASSASSILFQLGAIKSQRQPLCSTIEWNEQNIQIEVPYGHILYERIFDIFLLSNYNEEKEIDGSLLTRIVFQHLEGIIEDLKKTKLILNDVEEEKRWSFALQVIGHCACQAYTGKIIEDVKPLTLRALELSRLIKPFVKSNHKYLLNYMNQIKFDLAVLLGSYYCQKHDFDYSEAYYNSALRLFNLKLGHNSYSSTMYCILNGLSEIHFQRGDFLEAEVQYDHCTRYICKKAVLSHPSNPKSVNIYIVHHELANRYQREKKWKEEKRLRTKTLEVCELFIKKSRLYQLIPSMKNEITKIITYSKYRLNCIFFFHEMPQKLTQKFETVDGDKMLLIAKDSAVYQKVFPLLKSMKILRESECSEKSLVLKIILTAECHLVTLFREMDRTLYPQTKKRQTKALVEKPIPNERPQEDEVKESALTPFPHIPQNWKEKVKQNTARKQRGNKAKVDKNEKKSTFIIEQQNPIPPKACWVDKSLGELIFDKNQPECEVIVMRNEHNCGKPVFGYLPIHLFLELLRKYYSESDLNAILNEMKQTFSEAKQAGFFGRGIKSCPHLPLLSGTDYKIELKPSRSFKPIFRVFGRHISNGSNTLFIFDAIDRNPKSSASKLEIISNSERLTYV